MQHVDVLVVDDEIEIVRMITEVLSDEGYSVRSARDGVSALASVNTYTPALVLLDYFMPGMMGTDVLARLRAAGFTELPIIIMSASSRAETLRLSGANDFLSKPFDLDTLLTCVGRYVQPE